LLTVRVRGNYMLDLLAHDSKLPPKEEVLISVNRFVERCSKFYYVHGEKEMLLDIEELFHVIESAFKYLVNYKEFSGFKAAAVFTLVMANKKPFNAPLPAHFDPIRAEQNIVIGVLESLFWLHGAELMTQEGTKTIKNPIQFSDHYLKEFVAAISLSCQNFQANFQEAGDKSKSSLAALIYESVAYMTNPDVSYKGAKLNPLAEKAKLYFVAGTKIEVN
jgi:hypothetical protein